MVSVLLVTTTATSTATAEATVAGAARPPARAAAAIPVPACPQGGPCVVVQVLDGDRQTDQRVFTVDDLLGADADITDTTSYPVKGGNDAVVARGSTLARLVASVVGDPASVTFTEVVWNDTYQRHLLDARETRPGAQAGFQGGLVPAFYSDDPGRRFLDYVRPQRDADDANGTPGPDLGLAVTDQGGAFLVRVHLTGRILTPQVTATPTDSARRGYQLSTDQGGAGTTFAWVLPGGQSSSDAAPTYTFPAGAQAGTYPVSVGVSTADGSFGWGSASLQARDPPAPQPSATTRGPGGAGSASAGPTRRPTATLSADPDPTATGTGGPTSGATAGPPTLPPTLPPPTGPAGPSASTTATTTSMATPTATADPTADPTATATPSASGPGGTDVQGIVLTAGQPVVAAAPPVTADAPRASPSAAPLGRTPFRLATGVWVVGGLLALLAAGALSESDSARRRWRRALTRTTRRRTSR